MSMFDNYPQPSDYIPNNRPKHCKPHKLTIMTGETASHIFEVPFNIEELCSNYSVIYNVGITEILEKTKKELSYEVVDDKTFITCILSNVETKYFINNLLNANVQLKFIMLDGTISYSEIYKIKVENALDVENTTPPAPGPGILLGIGYTED